jgi:DNA-binding NtrC family response regulator
MSPLSTRQILVIEDDQIIIDFITELLNLPPGDEWPYKFKLRAFGTLASALPYLGGGAWDVIILDLNLSDSRGPKTFYTVQAATQAPIVVLTGAFNYSLKSQLLAGGAARCLSKIRVSLDLELLTDVLDNVIRERRKNKVIENQQATLMGELRNLVKECPSCHLWRDLKTDTFITASEFLQRYGGVEMATASTGSMCPACMQNRYGAYLADEKP